MTTKHSSFDINIQSPVFTSHLPQEGDYVRIPFRILSATNVGKGSWKSTDFSDEAVLKASMTLLEGIPAMIDHNVWSVQGAIGVIQNPRWEAAYTDEKGVQIPAGIVADYVIDAKQHADLIRKLLGVPDANPPILPAVNGSSVSIRYEYKPSHDFSGRPDPEWEFERNIGLIINGEEVRRIVTKIEEYRESSLVNFPADKFARNRIGRQEAKTARSMMSLSFNNEPEDVQNRYKNEKTYNVFLGEVETEEGYLAIDSYYTALQEAQKSLHSTKEIFKKRASELLAENFSFQTSNTALQTQITDYAAQVSTLQTKLDKLNSEISELKPQATLGQAYLIDLRRETEKLYQLAVGEVDENMLKMIQDANFDALKAFHAQYNKVVSEKHKATCQSCGADDLTRQSSQKPLPTEGKQSQFVEKQLFDNIMNNR